MAGILEVVGILFLLIMYIMLAVAPDSTKCSLIATISNYISYFRRHFSYTWHCVRTETTIYLLYHFRRNVYI